MRNVTGRIIGQRGVASGQQRLVVMVHESGLAVVDLVVLASELGRRLQSVGRRIGLFDAEQRRRVIRAGQQQFIAGQIGGSGRLVLRSIQVAQPPMR